jgi:hypothetical protein
MRSSSLGPITKKIDLEALSEGYIDIPEEEPDTIDEEVLESAKILAAKFKEEGVPRL